MNLRAYLCIFFSFAISMLNYSYCNGAKQWKSKCPVLNIPNAKIRIRARGRMAKIRCESDFTMIEGDRRLTCIKGQWNGRIPQCISSGCNIDSVPNGGAIELYDGALLHFHCNPGYTLTGSPALFCDGSKWNSSYPLCEVPPANPDHLSCTFETNDLCGWVQDHLDDLDWKWTSGTNNAFSGSLEAKTDHTLLTPAGHYIFADSKDDWFHGSVARMFSPILANPVETPSCVIFWYHMNGHTSGSLNVYIKPESDPFELLAPVFTVTGFNEDAWKLGYVGLPDIFDEDFIQVIFEAKGGDDHNSDIAIDDFLVTSGEECFDAEVKLIEQQSYYASLTRPSFTNRPNPTRPVKLTTKVKGKSAATISTEGEEFDYTYVPLSTSSMKGLRESTTISTYVGDTSAAPLELTTKSTTPRKIYISSHKPTLPIILVPTPPPNIILTSFLPRRTITPPLILSTSTKPSVATAKELPTTRTHITTTRMEASPTIDNVSQNPSTNSLKNVTSTTLINKTTSPITAFTFPKHVSSTFTFSPRPTRSHTYKKSTVESTTEFPITLPSKYTSLLTENMPTTIIMSSPKSTTKITTTSSITNKPQISTNFPFNYTASDIFNSSSSSNQLHTRPLPGVVILISIVAVGLAVTGILFGMIWIKRRRLRPFLAEDSDVRQLKEEISEEDHSTEGGPDEKRNRRTFPTSYRPLENNVHPQEYDGTPV